MWSRILYTAVFVFLIASLFGQNDTKQTNDLTKSFLNKKNQHSLSLEFAALSYTYVHQFKPKLNLGVRAQIGLGFKLALKSNNYFDVVDIIDVFKLQLIYRLPVPKHFHIDVGPFAALGYILDSGGISYGIEASVIYNFWKMHVGMRLGNSFYTIGNQSKYIGFSIIPIVLGINF